MLSCCAARTLLVEADNGSWQMLMGTQVTARVTVCVSDPRGLVPIESIHLCIPSPFPGKGNQPGEQGQAQLKAPSAVGVGMCCPVKSSSLFSSQVKLSAFQVAKWKWPQAAVPANKWGATQRAGLQQGQSWGYSSVSCSSEGSSFSTERES